MSLIIVSKYNNGIILASDSFVMKQRDDGRILSSQRFDRPLIIPRKRIGIAYVGSVWVYNKFIEWFNDSDYSLNNMKIISSKWAELNGHWLENRKLELSKSSSIPLSRSTIVIVSGIEVSKIHSIDYKGKIHQIESFIVAGSGADLIKSQLNIYSLFDSTRSLDYQLNKLLECYKIASADLAVSGIPAINIIGKNKIFSINSECKRLWEIKLNDYYEEVKEVVLNQLR